MLIDAVRNELRHVKVKGVLSVGMLVVSCGFREVLASPSNLESIKHLDDVRMVESGGGESPWRKLLDRNLQTPRSSLPSEWGGKSTLATLVSPWVSAVR